MSPSTHPASSLRQRLAWGVLLLALVLAPALGRMHQVLHGPGGAGGAHASAHDGARQALDTLHALFAGHVDADCQVLDEQSTLGGAWQVPALALARPVPHTLPAVAPATPPATRRPAPFHARAPPVGA